MSTPHWSSAVCSGIVKGEGEGRVGKKFLEFLSLSLSCFCFFLFLFGVCGVAGTCIVVVLA